MFHDHAFPNAVNSFHLARLGANVIPERDDTRFRGDFTSVPAIDPQCVAPSSPGSQVNLAWLRALDLKVAWAQKIREGITIQCTVGGTASSATSFTVTP